VTSLCETSQSLRHPGKDNLFDRGVGLAGGNLNRLHCVRDAFTILRERDQLSVAELRNAITTPTREALALGFSLAERQG